MSINIIKNLVPESKYSIKCPNKIVPTRIVVHNTANDASARNEISYMIRNNKEISFHFAVDDKEIVQGLPLDRNGWHASDGHGPGNMEGIAIEICYSKSGGERFLKAEENAVLLIVDILKRYGWSIDKVTKHQDYTNKYCPHRTLDLGWNRFIKMIEDKLKENEKYILVTSVPVYTNSDNAKKRINPVKTYEEGEYFIFNEKNGMLNITKKKSSPGAWINPEDNIVKSPVKNEESPVVDGNEEPIKVESPEIKEPEKTTNPLIWFIDKLVKLLTELMEKLK